MDNADYDFETEKVIEEVRKSGAKRVGLQFPEGLKTCAVDVAREIEEKTGAVAIIYIDPVYGACDTKEKEGKMLKTDLLVHFGHTAMKPKLCKRL